jgi:hypothetical protein
MKITIFLCLVALVAACNPGTTSNKAGGNSNAEVKKGVAPIADKEIAVIELENSAAYGTITIEL